MTQDNLKLPRPRGWSVPKLTGFFEHMWGHVIATFAKKQEAHRLCRIDDLMLEITDDWRVPLPTPQTSVPLLMFFRAHAAYRAACALGMAGMTVEGMAVLRLSLEFAAYACFLKENPQLAMVWWDRDVNKKTKQKARDEFPAGEMKRAVKRLNEGLGKNYEDLYDRTIQWGGHPNEKTVTQSLGLKFRPGETVLEQVYLQGDGIPLDHWIRTGSQVGICVLKIFEHVHHERFEKLNVRARIDPLAQGL